MAQGHMIPMVDIAKLLASRGVMVTIVTTPLNAARFESSLNRVIDELDLLIELVKLRFPCVEAGLPEGCENCDMLPSIVYMGPMLKAATMMEPEVVALFEGMAVRPMCIISDFCLPYTNNVAKKFNIPRITFTGFSCFCLVCMHCVKLHGDEIDRSVGSDHEYFVLPGLPGKIEFTKVQLPILIRKPSNEEPKNEFDDNVVKAESDAYGEIVNSFEELEPDYFSVYKNSKQGKVWCVGPVSLTNHNKMDKLQRGSNTISLSNHSLDWLDTKEPKSVIYVCFGSICNLSSPQLIELALGLEASGKPFIWAFRETETTKDLQKWIVDDGYEDRVAGRGLVIRGWAPQGHLIPMVDIAKILARRGVTVTIITTPLNAARFEPTLRRAIDGLGLRIDLVEIPFPSTAEGLPEGCENVDMLPSFDYLPYLYKAAAMMEPQVESLFENMSIRPTCIVSDAWLPYTCNVAKKFDVSRVSFHGTGCFSLLCIHCVKLYREEIDRRAGLGDERFVVPGMPGAGEIEFTRVQLPLRLRMPGQANPRNEFGEEMAKAESEAYGVIVNSFEELESEYYLEYKKSKQGKVWCIGPVSLTSLDELDKLQRGNGSISLSHRSLDWLDIREPESVVYVSLGSICNLSSRQLIELALGLEASETPFIWVIRETEATKDLYRWIMDDGFEDRVAARGIVIRGWAPQVSILSHRSVGGFLTHCGWNSSLEGIAAGIPLVTWPLFGDQFSNEKLIVEVAKVGVRVGAERPTFWDGKEETNVSIKRGDVERAVRLAMDRGNERRKRATKLAEMARKAVESDGSSYRNVSMFIEDIVKHQEGRRKK
ncbi:UDP-glycosyltransferase 1 [Linum perenne]